MPWINIFHISLETWGCFFCIIFIICMVFSHEFESKKRTILIALLGVAAFLLFMDALAWAFRGYPGNVGYWMVRISNFCVFEASDLMFIFFHAYVWCQIFEQTEKKEAPVRVWLGYLIGTIGMLIVLISQFTDFYYYFDVNNFYHRNVWYPIALIIPLSGMLLDLSLIIQYRRKIKKGILISMLSYIILPIISVVLLFFYYGISLTNIAMTLSVIFMFIAANIEQSRELLRKEKEMSEMQTKMMLSQIGPHFIYNTLTAIKHLCRTNPEMAAETVDEFAVYLRGNIDSLTQKKKIMFTQELNHVRNYLSIEKKRFGDRIQVEYDIEEKDFMIPALTLQPLVENAVKHGITKKENGGTIHISSRAVEQGYEVIIDADGVGYKPSDDDKIHTGISNVSGRLKSMSDGTLSISNRAEGGTHVVIFIPAEHYTKSPKKAGK